MPSSSRWRLVTLVGLGFCIVSLAILYIGDRPLMRGKRIQIPVPQDGVLAGTYHEGCAPAAALLLEGFGSDQATLRSMASTFARSGYHVLTFDFSGHGRSPGGLTFDNAATDRLARQVIAAKSELEARSGLTADRLLFVGHSMGARVGLQAATMIEDPPVGLILLGAQVNVDTNVQAEVFTGVADTELDWVQDLGPTVPPTNILLISGALDDILTPSNARLLLRKLTDGDSQDDTEYGALPEGTGRRLIILDALLHNYEVVSPRALAQARSWSVNAVGDDAVSVGADPMPSIRIALWLSGLAGLFAAVIAGRRWVDAISRAQAQPAYSVTVTQVQRFLMGKLLLWLASLPLIALLFGLFFFLPLATPVFNLIYVGCIGGYGLLMLALYAVGRAPGAEGRLPFITRDTPVHPLKTQRLLLVGGVTALLFVLVTAYVRSGWFLAPPTGQRLLWLVLFTPFTALGFWIGLHEQTMLKLAQPARLGPRVINTFLGLMPFFLWTLFQAAIGSLSGMVSGAQGLVILAFVLAFGTLVQRLAQRPWLTAILQAVVLYWLILPQGVLFI